MVTSVAPLCHAQTSGGNPMSQCRSLILLLVLIASAVQLTAQEPEPDVVSDADSTSWIAGSRFLSAQFEWLYRERVPHFVWRVGVDLDFLCSTGIPYISAGVRAGLELNPGDEVDFSFVDVHYNGLLRLSAVHPWVRCDLYTGYAYVDRSEVSRSYHLLKAGADLRLTILPRIISAVASYNAPLLGLGSQSARNFRFWGFGLAIGWQP
jgi:hypothetical protein